MDDRAIVAGAPEAVNPYIAGNPVTGSIMFFGREDIFSFVRRSLVGRHRDNILVLYGQRRSGKTSVLYQLRHRLAPDYACIFIDLQALALDSVESFLWELAGHIARGLRRDYAITLARPEREAFRADPRGHFEHEFLPGVWGALGERHLLLLLDEATRLQEQVEAGRLDPAVFAFLRHLMQHHERLAFLFAIGSGVEELAREYALLFNAALYKKVSFLEPEAALALITEPPRGCYEVTPPAVARIAALTSNHPYYTQLLCHSLFNRWQRQPFMRATAAEIDALVGEVVERGSAVLTHVWEESTPAEQAALAGLVAAVGPRGGRAGVGAIRRAWAAAGVDLPEEELEGALRSLLARDVIVGDDRYRFAVDLQRRWIEQHRRLAWVRDDLIAAGMPWMVTTVPPRPVGLTHSVRGQPALALGAVLLLLIVSAGGLLVARGAQARRPAATSAAVSEGVFPSGGRYTTLDGVGRRGGGITQTLDRPLETLNPLLGNALPVALIFNALVGTNPDTGAPYADLAESVPTRENGGLSRDGLTYTFRLRRDVKWGDGQTFTARDVLFTYTLAGDATAKSPFATQLAAHIASVTAPDDYTVLFTLRAPVASFLANDMLRIVPEHILRDVKGESLRFHPFSQGDVVATVGTGPFAFKSGGAGRSVLALVKNPNYFRGEPALDRISFEVVPPAASASLPARFGAGDLDYGEVPARFFQGLSGERLSVRTFDRHGAVVLGFQLDPAQSTLLADQRIRQALAYALDRGALLKASTFGLGTVAQGTLPPPSWAYAPEAVNVRYPYDPARAARLLDAAGWTRGPDGVRVRDGQRMEFTIMTCAGCAPFLPLIQQQWWAVGVMVTSREVDGETLARRLREEHNFVAFVADLRWGPDPDQSALWACDAYPGGANYSRYCNARVDDLLRQGLAEPDRGKRKAIYAQVQDAVLDDLPALPLFFPQETIVVNTRVHNLLPNPTNVTWNAHLWWVDGGK